MTFDDFRRDWTAPGDHITAHTSGSTGAPKEIRLSKADMRASARATNRFFCITADSVLAIPLSADYIAGKMMAVRAYEAGCALDVIKPSNSFRLKRDCTLLSVVPSQVPALLEMADAGMPLPENVIVGGAALDPVSAQALARGPWRAFCSYGMTETCSHVALRDLAEEGTTYRAMPGVGFSTDSRGCLVIHAPEFSFGSLVTNDVVSLHDSESFSWLGRYDNVINSGGIKMYPEQLEEMYSPFIDVPYYVTGMPHPRWGQCVALVAEGVESDAEALMRILSDNIPHTALPKVIRMVKCIPLTPNGKIRRVVPGD